VHVILAYSDPKAERWIADCLIERRLAPSRGA
jgi:hypothetical protein